MADYKENVLKLRQEVQEAVALGTINSAPFGFAADIDTTAYEPLDRWIQRGGMGEL